MISDRISSDLAKRFKIPPPLTIATRIGGASEIAFSRFQRFEPSPGLCAPAQREEAFAFYIPLAAARFSIIAIDGKGGSVVQLPGQAYLFDLTSRNEVSLDAINDNIRIHIPQAAIDNLAYDRGLRRVGGLRAKEFGQEDQIFYHISNILLPAIMDSHRVTAAFLEYISLALHDHLMYTYGGVPRGGHRIGGLAPWQARRACDYIEANLEADLSITALSEVCGLSASHFARAFRASLGMPPHRWITSRRIERAKSLMAVPAESLAEISATCGFFDQSHFSRLFLKQEGISPAQWRHRYGPSRPAFQ